MEWQPIETAPRDGTYVLLWETFLDNPFVGCWHSGGWVADLEHVEAEGGWNGAIAVSDVYTDYVTHWMPLPEPPE